MIQVFTQEKGETKAQFMARIGRWVDELPPIGGGIPSVARFDQGVEPSLLWVTLFLEQPYPRE